jgi:hypothetical protein
MVPHPAAAAVSDRRLRSEIDATIYVPPCSTTNARTVILEPALWAKDPNSVGDIKVPCGFLAQSRGSEFQCNDRKSKAALCPVAFRVPSKSAKFPEGKQGHSP